MSPRELAASLSTLGLGEIDDESNKDSAAPVTLIYRGVPRFTGPKGYFGKFGFGHLVNEVFSSRADALKRAELLMDQGKGHNFRILAGTVTERVYLPRTEATATCDRQKTPV